MHIRWGELQTLEAVVRTGTLDAAARELSLRHTSVSRRLDALERALGQPLFVRGKRLAPTPLALELAGQAAPMRARALAVGEVAERWRRAHRGQVVVTTTDVLAPLLFAALGQVRPSRQIQTIVGDRVQDLSPGVVDLALRPSHEPGGTLLGRRLGVLRIGVFRRKGAARGWILPAMSLRSKTSIRWWREIPEDAAGGVVCDSLLAMRDACVAGLGRAVLPAYLVERDPRVELERVVEGGTPVWLLAPGARVAADRAVRELRDALARALAALPGVWAGRERRP